MPQDERYYLTLGPPTGPNWEQCSFKITIVPQADFPPAKRYHFTYLHSLGNIEIEEIDGEERVVIVRDGFIETKKFESGRKMVSFATSTGSKFWINIYDNKHIQSFERL